MRTAEIVVVYYIGAVRITQEFGDGGGHIISVGSNESLVTAYDGIAILHCPEGVFCGTSEFYEGVLPRVFKVTPGVPWASPTNPEKGIR